MDRFLWRGTNWLDFRTDEDLDLDPESFFHFSNIERWAFLNIKRGYSKISGWMFMKFIGCYAFEQGIICCVFELHRILDSGSIFPVFLNCEIGHLLIFFRSILWGSGPADPHGIDAHVFFPNFYVVNFRDLAEVWAIMSAGCISPT